MIAVLLLVFGLTPAYIFPITADIPVHPHYDVSKVGGVWHPIGIASQLPELTEYEQKISPMDHRVEILDGGDLKLTVYYMSDGVCKEAVHVFKHTVKPGVFKISDGNVYVMDVDYENYTILYVEKRSHDAMLLSARGSEVGDDIKEKFKQLVLAQQIPEAHIIYFENIEQCTP